VKPEPPGTLPAETRMAWQPVVSRRILNVAMSDVTQILQQIESGDPSAAEQLLPLVYDELRKLAAARLADEKPGQTLQATALVHEAYLRLVDVDQAQHWNGRGHFFGAAAEAMRRIIIERARARKAAKAGGGQQRVPLDGLQVAGPEPQWDLLAIDAALEQLEQIDPQAGEIVKLRYFVGMTIPEAAAALGVSPSTVDRQWAWARAWLHAKLQAGNDAAARGC
jgi:RNA polymerase sigma factor (TIGR02999 family)